MLHGWQYQATGSRDLRIDWLRGLAMTFVIVNHTKLSSVLTWFSYERFWTVTAAEVFVVLSGIVIGMVSGRKLRRGDWRGVLRGLSRRALILYLAFLGVALSVVLIQLTGFDVWSIRFIDADSLDAADWRDIALMRTGPWAFEIVCLYVWLVAAAAPCLIALRYAGSLPVLGVSWALYLWYRLSPHTLTAAEFETVFPILAWQLLFVHGLVIGYHRERIGAFIGARRKPLTIAAGAATCGFIAFALCNPWTEGPRLLHLHLLPPERFAELYAQYFGLEELGAGRLLNLLVALPLAYAVLTAFWKLAAPLGKVFVTLGQQSLGAFVLHVYAIMLIAHSSAADGLWIHTALQVTAVLAIATLLNLIRRQSPRRAAMRAPAHPLPA